MKLHAMHNFHLPLPGDVRDMLREEADRSGRPATAVARQALEEWLRGCRRTRLREEITEYASAAAGTTSDLDEALEEAASECLADEGARETR